MPYCTLNDLKTRISEEKIIQLTDDSGVGVIDETVVNQAITEADDLINGYLRGRYELPLSDVPGLIKIVAMNLAAYNLYARRMDIEMSDPVKDRYKNSISILSNIQAGKILLGIDSGSEESAAVVKTNKTAEDRIFPKSVLDTF